MFPLVATAVSLVPSLEEVMLRHHWLPTEVSSVHVSPESVEVQIFSALPTAASLVPSLERVMLYQSFELPTEVQVTAFEQVAEVSVPALQDDVPDTVYPELHVGWQVDPLAREFVQSPAPPLVGAPEASHVSITDTGIELEVWLPSPSCPLSLLPQHLANSSVSRAHEG